MSDLDLEAIKDSFDEYKKIVNSKQWFDLTVQDLEFVDDIEKKKKFRYFFTHVINPLLYHMKTMKDFKFSHSDNDLTCKNMLEDVLDYYQNLGFDKSDIAQIACDRSSKKY